MQIYISTCILFVTAALFEYCGIIAMLRFPIDLNEENPEDVLIEESPVESNGIKKRLTIERQIKKNRLSRAGFLDMCCMVIFTIFFAHFNVIYFVIVNNK